MRDLTLPPDVTVNADPDCSWSTCRGAPDERRGRGRSRTQPEVIKPERKEKDKDDE